MKVYMPYSRIAILFFVIIQFSCKTSKNNSLKESSAQTDVVAAKPEETSDSPQSLVLYEKAILGTWKWDMTKCCFRQPRITRADSLPYPKLLNFKPDGTLQTFHGDTLKATTTYEVKYGFERDDNRPVLQIEHRTAFLFIKGDTLIIDYGYMDLQTEWYVRRK